MKLNPYLIFNGNCEEAMNFYKDCLGAEIVSMNYFEGSPAKHPDSYKNKVLHCAIKFGDNYIMASDTSPDYKVASGTNSYLSLNLNDNELSEKIFGSLSQGGSITVPLQKSFWGAKFGMFTDKYGTGWMINCEQ